MTYSSTCFEEGEAESMRLKEKEEEKEDRHDLNDINL